MEYIKTLKDYGINTDNQTYLIAEVGINHGGDMDLAKRIIESVARTGADAVKFQTYLTEKRVPRDSPIFDILKKCELPFDAFAELQAYAKTLNLDFFSTPFDTESVDYLASINCDLYKVASFDVVNKNLLGKVAATGKPVIMSVGMSSLEEIKTAYNILKEENSKLAILHCISSYPTMEEDASLSVVFKLKQTFDCVIGQSDHTNDIFVPLMAAAAGAQILEKHFKIDDAMECVDAPVSITEKQLTELVDGVRRIEKVMGSNILGVRETEKSSTIFRRFN
jgi:N,N'-diacetyllegionaminate synthase